MANEQRERGPRRGWAAWIALKMMPGVGNVLGLGLVRAFGTPEAVFAARDQDLQCAGVRREGRGGASSVAAGPERAHVFRWRRREVSKAITDGLGIVALSA